MRANSIILTLNSFWRTLTSEECVHIQGRKIGNIQGAQSANFGGSRGPLSPRIIFQPPKSSDISDFGGGGWHRVCLGGCTPPPPPNFAPLYTFTFCSEDLTDEVAKLLENYKYIKYTSYSDYLRFYLYSFVDQTLHNLVLCKSKLPLRNVSADKKMFQQVWSW